MLDRVRKSSKDEEKKDEQSTLQEIQTPAGDETKPQTASVKNGIHSTGNISDEAEGKEEERPTKRARKEASGTRPDAEMTASADDEQPTRADVNTASAGSSSAVSTTNNNPVNSTSQETARRARKSSRTKAQPAAASKPPPETRQLRSRSYPQNPAPAKKPSAHSSKTSMNLRKRSAVNNTSTLARREAAQATGPVSNVYKEHRRSIDVGECEVCLHPYALSYLSKHRNKVHGLAHTTYGCPYCLTTFSSLESRLAHIKERHPGKPAHWTGCSNLNNVKAHLYACPLCPAHFTHSGLACHMGSSHHTSIDAFAGQVYIKCPFCLSSDCKQVGRFPSEQELKEHIAKKHKGYFLLDDFKPPADRVFTRPGGDKPVSTAAAPKKPPPPPQESSDDDEEEEDVWEEEEGDDEEHWERLDHNGLIKDYLYGDYVAVDFGMGGLSTAITAVEDQLTTLQETTKGAPDEDYIAEMKLYNKGLKDRKQKADAERIEKERHREEVEKKLMELEYENRNKKKKKRSAEEIEYDAFIDRPISFAAATRESARKTSCPFGEDCELCVSHDQDPETDSSGQLIDAPSCRTNVVGDSLNVPQSPDADDGDSRRGGRSRRGRRVDPTTRSLLMLHEMKHSLGFVAGYNAGYFRR